MKKLIFTALSALIMQGAYAQTEKATTISAPMSEEEAKMMKAYEEYAKPGPQHAMMAKDDGYWSEEITMWMAPGAPPTVSTAKVVNSMILGGRYQQSTHSGSFNDMPFEGISTLAYDNAKKMFISTWIDNMGTGIMIMEGKPVEQGKTMHMKGKQVDPVTGKDMDVREEITFTDDGTQKMKMFMTPVGGKEYQTMEIVLTRMKK
ncbi:MAG TPA: DUF1579 domain-containing protein [Bacteroidia bacterium]|nr:DUF1579 domain-containing protein [Bacteroidia bacterium]